MSKAWRLAQAARKERKAGIWEMVAKFTAGVIAAFGLFMMGYCLWHDGYDQAVKDRMNVIFSSPSVTQTPQNTEAPIPDDQNWRIN